jgi:hypothetical protein
VRTVEHDGDRYLLLKRSTDESLVRDPETGETRHLPTDDLTVTGDPPLATAAGRVPEPTRRVVAAVHSEAALGLLVELDERGPLGVRELLGVTERCESDLHGLVGELQAAGMVAETEVDGERGYRLTDGARAGLLTLTG